MENKRISSRLWIGILLAWGVILLVNLYARTGGQQMAYSEFKAAVAADKVEEVVISGTLIRGRMKGEPHTFEIIRVSDEDLLRDLTQHGVKVTGTPESANWWSTLLVPLGIVILFWFLFMRRAGAGQSGFLAVGHSKAKVYMEKEVKVSFADVAGVDEAKEELHEVIEFLQTPDKFRRLGGRIPKGILLVGPPGTGKTLLAKAVAGEAGVPFFSISGSEFVEMFVGVGAARVRDLFLQAREKAPCIIFIDELDALGKARGVGPFAHEEREQTLNQLLVEMDGFDTSAGVVLMAATNRPEILDPALLRAGRFDRHILVDRPDKAGRVAILRIHSQRMPLAKDADLDVVAGMTAGFVGADLANLVNEASLLAVRRGKDEIGLPELQEAVERVIAGLEKRNRVLNKMERERVAHHEIGHALVAMSLPGIDAVQKISIIPRGIAALGYTLQLPTEDRFLMTQRELENKIAVLLGGRVAEELVYGELSTGAQDDLVKATDIARSMVKVYGMSPKLGHLSFERAAQPLLEPLEPSGARDYSESVMEQIDAEVRRIIDEQHERVTRLLAARVETLRAAAAELLVRETISGEELRTIIERATERPASARPTAAAAR